MIVDNDRKDVHAIERALQAQAVGRKPSVTFDEVWRRHNNSEAAASGRPAGRFKTAVWSLSAAALLIAAMLGCTPSVRAALDEWITVKLLTSKHAQASIVHHWKVQRKWDEVRSYDTLAEAAKSVGVPFPVPAQLLAYEKDALSRQYNVTTDQGQIAGYHFSIRTRERMLDVTAKYEEPAVPSFTAESKAQATVKETSVEGHPAKLFRVQEFPGYTLYWEQDGWKFVISGYASGVGSVQPAPFTEEELMRIAASIR